MRGPAPEFGYKTCGETFHPAWANFSYTPVTIMFALLSFLVIAVAFGVFWVLFLALFISGRRTKSQLTIWVGGVLLALQTGIGVKAGYEAISIWKPENVYKTTFGSSPPNDVTNIQSYYYYLGDLGMTYLKFNASPSTIRNLTAKGWTRLKGQGLADARASNDTHRDADDDTPSWYKPKVTQSTVIYRAKNRFGDFARENETLTHDTATQQAYYDFLGID